MRLEALWQILFPAPNSEQNILSAHMYPSAAVPGIFTVVQPSQKQRHKSVTKEGLSDTTAIMYY